MPISTRRISAACIIMLAASTGACADANPTGVAVPKQPAHSVSIAAATAWTASGPGTVTVVSDGTAGDAGMTYNYSPPQPDNNLYTWDFETTSDQTATVTLPWSYEGNHGDLTGNGGQVELYAVVNDAVVDTLVFEYSEGLNFAFSGTYTFTVSAGDTYGFRPSGNTDSNMNGTFTVDLPAPGEWTASGPGAVTVVSDGTAGDAVMTYQYATQSLWFWNFTTTAADAGTVTLPWTASGDHGDGGSVDVLAVVNGEIVALLGSADSGVFTLSGTYTFTVNAGDTYGFRFGGEVASGAANPVLSGTFTVDLPEAPVNTAPVLAPIANQVTDEGSTLNFTASATDADAGQTVTYSLVGAPAGASIDPTTGVFSWTPTDDDPTATPTDADTFTVRATDDGDPAAFDEQEVIITVSNVDPTITSVTAPTSPIVLSGGSATAPVSFTFTDPGSGDTHTAFIACSDSTGVAGTAGNCTYTAPGVYTVLFFVTDDDDGQDTETAQVVVVYADPASKDDCKNGGWRAFGFQSQGQCILFVNTGHDSR